MTKKICVIGAGIVGISVALKLSQQGHQVMVLDREGVAAEASQGNAGAFAFTDVLPLASPGIMRNAPKWLLDPLGPLSVPPKYALQIAPWLFRFWRASWPDRHEASIGFPRRNYSTSAPGRSTRRPSQSVPANGAC